MRSSRADPGFSLLELLVTIGIIAILLAILLPVLSSVRRASRATACLAKLQQWSAIYRIYVNDRKVRGVPRGPVPTKTDQATPLFWWEVLLPKERARENLLCPEATDPSNGTPSSPLHTWGPEYFWDAGGKTRGPFVGSYGFNAWLYSEIREDGSASQTRPPEKSAASVPIVFDSARLEIYPFDTDPPKLFEPRGTAGLGLPWAALRRHGDGSNVSFLDGHAEHLLPPRLWELKWSNEFRPQAVTIQK